MAKQVADRYQDSDELPLPLTCAAMVEPLANVSNSFLTIMAALFTLGNKAMGLASRQDNLE